MKARAGQTSTISISVDEETLRILKVEAKRSYGGNDSALVTVIAKEAKRQAAFDWLLARPGTPVVSDADLDAFVAEIDGKPAPKKHRRSAA